MFTSVVELNEALRESGYIADPVTVTTVFLASRLHRPVLLEGPAGSGKTQLAYAVAEAAQTTVERLNAMRALTKRRPSADLTSRCSVCSFSFRPSLRKSTGMNLHSFLRAEDSLAPDHSYWRSNMKSPASCSSTNSTR